jgi:hypothetical protein
MRQRLRSTAERAITISPSPLSQPRLLLRPAHRDGSARTIAGRRLVAAPTTPPLSGPGTVISFGATGHGAVTALYAHGVIQNPAILSSQTRTPSA